MKKTMSLLLVLAMVLSLFAGCGGETAAEAPEVEATQPAVGESPEIQQLLQEDWIPETIRENLDETIVWSEMLDMLAGVIVSCEENNLDKWNEIIRPTDWPMRRDEGMLAIYEAACVLGIGHQGRNGWQDVNAYYSAHPELMANYNPNGYCFTNVKEIAPYEPNPGWEPEWDYIACARLYSMGQSSGANPEPFFAYAGEDTRFDDPLTRREAITATAKLIQAYEYAHSGGYTIPQTNWDDPLLSDAKAAREAILNSPTAITKGDELIPGETYTGNAYYVSNSGDDGNDGLSPETPWATLEKVEKAKLKYGDAVFFERGGTWYGRLKMQHGVTYSAYGEGAKPVITGSPLNAAQEDQWVLYTETDDGGKIWQYAEEMPDAGVILLNGGEMVARKAYPMWNGQEYINSEGESFVLEEELADLMFFSALNLRGVQLDTIIEGDGRTGPLYLRCDAGNPGEIYEMIEISVVSSGTTTADKGWNAIDNLHFRCFAVSGMDCNNHSNIIYQNCETDWCGGAVKNYQTSWYNPEDIMAVVSGGGMLLFGTDLTCKNNYIHDCESKGIAIVTNAPNGNPAWLNRFNILAEGNVVEHCGSGALLWVDNAAKDRQRKFEDIRFVGNFFVNGSYGWRQMNTRDLVNNRTQAVAVENLLVTGEVLFENNLFYRAVGTLVNWSGNDLENSAVLPTLRGNTYVQDKGQLLLVKKDELPGHFPEATLAISDQTLMETCVRESMGDATGKVIILE